VTVLEEEFATLADLLEQGRQALKIAAHTGSIRKEYRLLSPLTKPSKLLCQGLNYRDHRDESGMTQDAAEKENITFFMKDNSSLCGPNDDIIRPTECRLLDYEIELGLVLGKAITGPLELTEEQLEDYVAGMLICNDVSARDIMFGASFLQWYMGKSFRTFCPAGPILYIFEPGEINKIFDLNLNLWLNGELRQSTHTSLLIHSPWEALAALSEIVDMDVGDCLLTGTPGGVIAQATPNMAKTLSSQLFHDAVRKESLVAAELARASYLKQGDELRLEIRSPDGSVDLGMQVCHIKDN
jgi:2-keto-4-pentenoate hydratase/2-oxohepta-3-ene-1,7-dioic acid hydratase in catechol pathway